MNEAERIPFHIEINRIIDILAKQIYPSPLALLRENCQNAYDAILMRRHLGDSFQPRIEIVLTETEVRVVDNGIGMTKQELKNHFWRAGSSGKDNPEARAAGVVGTFGIGAMANFGVASALTVTSESARDSERTTCRAVRASLSATEECIDIVSERPTGEVGTTVIAEVPHDTPINVAEASNYISGFVRFLDIPVTMNGDMVSQQDLRTGALRPPPGWEYSEANVALGSQIKANVELVIAKTGEVWVQIDSIQYSDRPIDGIIMLHQGTHQIQTLRSRFGLTMAAVSSVYEFGGVANLSVLEPTAGREALTSSSLHFLQSIITAIEKLVSEKFAETELSNLNTSFMRWAAQNGRFELCSKLSVRLEPDTQSIPLEDVKKRSEQKPFNCYQGSDQSLISQYATDEQPLIVVSASTPRKKCELAYLQSYCTVRLIEDTPTVLSRKSERDWTLAESALALRLIAILDSDYFVKVGINFGKISHGLPVFLDTSKQPIETVLDSDGATVALMLKLYETDFASLTGVVKDFVRNIIFPRIANFVPSSTRQGAEAFLRAIRRPRDVFEYGRADLASLTELWQDYLDGKIAMEDAARQSADIVRGSVQVVDRAATTRVSEVIPDVLENQMILEQSAESVSVDEFEPLPAYTRPDKESQAKLLMIDDDERPLNGYRCFVAVIDRMREEHGEFFLQPHRTEIVWGGQKALYIFQHHSGHFALYYELQSTEVLSSTPGGRVFNTSTIALKNQIYIPVPDEIRQKFIPQDTGRKRFEIRFEFLYPDVEEDTTKEGVGR